MNRPSLKARLSLVALLLAPGMAFAQRHVTNFNGGWRFTKGEQPEAVRQSGFDDSSWQAVRLPHDWAIAGPFDANVSGSTGKLPWQGVGWYRKTFTPERRRGTARLLRFRWRHGVSEGLRQRPACRRVELRLHVFPCGRHAVHPLGQRNVIAVQVDTRRHQSRWYPGAGIYRKVTMTVTDPVHIAHWGMFVTTPAVADARATVRVQTSMENHRAANHDVAVEVALFDPSGKQVASGTQDSARRLRTDRLPWISNFSSRILNDGTSPRRISTPPWRRCAPEMPRSIRKTPPSASAPPSSRPTTASISTASAFSSMA